MHNIETRLTRCFQLIFPELGGREISEATPASISRWDSIATVTLVNVIEEEFDMQIALEDIEEAVSFTALLNYLQRRAANGEH